MRHFLLIAAAVCTCFAQTEAPKTAEQVYKNIVQLKGTPADQLLPAMQFMSASLGVECGFCHVQGKMDADDKPAKKAARSMIAMQMAINKESFGGRTQVTCNTCHRGSERPVSIPAVRESDTAAPEPASAPAPAMTAGSQPSADDILNRYVTAVGGPESLKKVTSRDMKGVLIVGASESPIEVITKAPNRRVSISRSQTGESYTAFDGTNGWMGNTGRTARDMAPSESAAAALDAEFYLPLRLKDLYPQLRRGRPEKINGADCDVLNGAAPGRPPVRLYFNKDSGLLVRMVRYADTPLGRIPTQIDYADYRDSGGSKIPYRWTLSRPNGRFTIQVKEALANVQVNDAKFAKPAGEVK